MRFLRLLALSALYCLAAVVLISGLIFVDRALNKPLNVEPNATLLVKSGTSVNGLAADLKKRGWLDNKETLSLYARITGKAPKIRAGEYPIAQGTTIPELVQQLIGGKTIQHGLTIVEGNNFRELRAQLAAHPTLTQTLTASMTDAEVMAAIGQPGQHPEGRFLPETFLFPRGFSDVDLLKRAYADMEKALAAAWQTRDAGLPYASPYEALIMASIVEKETGQAFERPEIAGVFVRRLRKGMKLQTDPTVIYGMGTAYDGNIRRADLRRPTAYNTYTIAAMPPTPIAMPGKAAIDAALHPTDGRSLYFVSRNDGTHVFSATLKQHECNVDVYQRGKNRTCRFD